MKWQGVLPAITTPFDGDAVDHAFLAHHCRWLIERGAAAIVPLGSLGEGAVLSFDEKLAVLDTCVAACDRRTPVVAGIGATATANAVRLARAAAERACGGLMVLPPYLHDGPWAEAEAHLDAVLAATELPCMLYNNPIAYGTDVRPEAIHAFAERHDNLRAVKESSGDVRRITAIRALCGERLTVLVGLDDAVVEGVRAGATGWVAGLVNALPAESVELFERARDGRDIEALYRWFLPLLRMDVVPEFVQLIKLVQHEVGIGSENVRPPRQPLAGTVRARALATIGTALQSKPLGR